jgi:hypothetical protein
MTQPEQTLQTVAAFIREGAALGPWMTRSRHPWEDRPHPHPGASCVLGAIENALYLKGYPQTTTVETAFPFLEELEVVHPVTGVPLFAAGVFLWMFSMRRFFWGRRVLLKVNPDKSKEYGIERYQFEPGDSHNLTTSKGACGLAHFILIVGWSITWMVIIFS